MVKSVFFSLKPSWHHLSLFVWLTPLSWCWHTSWSYTEALIVSHLDYYNSLLAGLPACATWPLQLIQNAAHRLVFNLPKFPRTTHFLHTLLPVAAEIRIKLLLLAYHTGKGSGQTYIQDTVKPHKQPIIYTLLLLNSLPLPHSDRGSDIFFWHQNSRNPVHFLQMTESSLVQIAPSPWKVQGKRRRERKFSLLVW